MSEAARSRASRPQEIDDVSLQDSEAFQRLAVAASFLRAGARKPLLPVEAVERARVRALALIAVADGHPLVTPRVRAYLEGELGHGEAEYVAWCRHFMGASLAAMEGHLSRDAQTGVFCHADRPTLPTCAS